MIDLFQGDPAIKVTGDGADLVFRGGQPVMDSGLENQVTISLLTLEGWPGNHLLDLPNQIGSGFQEQAKKPITLTNLARLESVAEQAVAAPVFGTVEAEIINPQSSQINITIRVTPPGGTPEDILLTNNGQNWFNQADQPANTRL